MGVIRLVLRFGSGQESLLGGGAVAREVCPRVSAETITHVIKSCHASWMGPRSPAGLLAELHSRSGREVTSWLAFDSDRPVGFAAAVVAGARGVARHSIAWLLVSDDRRRRGVGRALVAAAVTRARERGAAEVWVETRSDWIDAVAFWRAVGFRDPA